MTAGPPYTIRGERRTVRGDIELFIRVAGGQQVKVLIPASRDTSELRQESIDAAIALMPLPPPPGS